MWILKNTTVCKQTDVLKGLQRVFESFNEVVVHVALYLNIAIESQQ